MKGVIEQAGTGMDMTQPSGLLRLLAQCDEVMKHTLSFRSFSLLRLYYTYAVAVAAAMCELTGDLSAAEEEATSLAAFREMIRSVAERSGIVIQDELDGLFIEELQKFLSLPQGYEGKRDSFQVN